MTAKAKQNTAKAKASQPKTETARPFHVAVVASRFNDFITKRLLHGCLGNLAQNGIGQDNVTVVWVPGAFEIPVTALKLALKKNVAAVICLGAVIRGETPHFDYVAGQAARGVMVVSLQTGKPVSFGILTTDTVDQAHKRSEPGRNKGHDAAQAAVDMVGVLKRL